MYVWHLLGTSNVGKERIFSHCDLHDLEFRHLVKIGIEHRDTDCDIIECAYNRCAKKQSEKSESRFVLAKSLLI